MPFWILIFNQHILDQINPQTLLKDLKAVHFSTLCHQYGLDPALIEPAVAHLGVEMAETGLVPYFFVRYRPRQQPPLVVHRWDAGEFWRHQGLGAEVLTGLPPAVREQLAHTQTVYAVALEKDQLSDLGLLLAYELARWLAHRGMGIVYGLDGDWYRLNAHQAFIPVE